MAVCSPGLPGELLYTEVTQVARNSTVSVGLNFMTAKERLLFTFQGEPVLTGETNRFVRDCASRASVLNEYTLSSFTPLAAADVQPATLMAISTTTVETATPILSTNATDLPGMQGQLNNLRVQGTGILRCAAL